MNRGEPRGSRLGRNEPFYAELLRERECAFVRSLAEHLQRILLAEIVRLDNATTISFLAWTRVHLLFSDITEIDSRRATEERALRYRRSDGLCRTGICVFSSYFLFFLISTDVATRATGRSFFRFLSELRICAQNTSNSSYADRSDAQQRRSVEGEEGQHLPLINSLICSHTLNPFRGAARNPEVPNLVAELPQLVCTPRSGSG